MLNLEYLVNSAIFRIPNDGDVFWLNYNEDSFRTISDFETFLSHKEKQVSEKGIDEISRLDDILTVASVQPVNMEEKNEIYHLALKSKDELTKSFSGNENTIQRMSIEIDTLAITPLNHSSKTPYAHLVADIYNHPDVERRQEKVSLYDDNLEMTIACYIRSTASLIAAKTRRGAGNVIIAHPDSVFNIVLDNDESIITRFFIIRSHIVKPTEILIGYRGEGGGKEVDAGCIFVPCNAKENKDGAEENLVYNHVIFPQYFSILEIENATD